MSNGDVWVSGKACYRHIVSENYIQMKSDTDESWTGGLTADIDVLRKGSALKHIEKHYKSY